ncbi:MAG: 2-oxoacid:acceptor oxidoreductase family protein [Dethiobacter sp.]|mgnify:FL=1|jgi:2-oxoglutarate ferredoxin oxidoreductase subunit gamma|nr:2-oxoacid:acceptor oxidoreductase family protein [Dethiobacter sp.]MBS3983428.1 2-oxoacid:acceptor oxidoreductase family protein [Dethiobacter sp.]MCL4463358.1 2-oxoacid:acceptor oxidoreductase family protein [Bacillota bacterium]MCL5992568.1 2-oxoacid:acceptor oxidoreductase family protein [Bacillota bacterium]
MFKKEIRFSGSGGQGIILAAVILADAAVQAGFYAVQTQSYGPEARGGASKAEVIFSDQPVDYPKVSTPDIFLALSAEAYAKYCHDLKHNGIIVLEETLLTPHCAADTLKFPVFATARKTGKEITANMVLLGILSSLLIDFLPKALLEQAINERVPSGTTEINLLAFNYGYALS